ncbi:MULTISPECIES: hypothetical protein [unclassified Bradyrhizobium]
MWLDHETGAGGLSPHSGRLIPAGRTSAAETALGPIGASHPQADVIGNIHRIDGRAGSTGTRRGDIGFITG